jgi:hypothetical protein
VRRAFDGHRIIPAVYATCLFCHAPLGRNEAVEAFPVGRRLAFDAQKGRLWVVCPSCARWNLTPLESRWEAIEECERSFRQTKLRSSTGEIGLAKIPEGTTLVRIGSPLLPEMAAWRYGDKFARRRVRYLAVGAATGVGIGAVAIGGPLAGVLTWSTALSLFNIFNMVRNWRPAMRIPVDGQVLKLTEMNVSSAALRPHLEQGFVLEFGHKRSTVTKESHKSFRFTPESQLPTSLTGDAAIRAARLLLPRVNKSGGAASDVQQGVALLERGDTVSALFTAAARTPQSHLNYWHRAAWDKGPERGPPVLLPSLPAPTRLALEMAVHETDERRAMEGELAALEERWREAEEIAAIADNLLVPKSVQDSMERLKG